MPMLFVRQPPGCLRRLIAAIAWVALASAQTLTPPPDPRVGKGAVATAPTIPAETVTLDAMQVRAKNDDPGFDATGMGSYEQQLRDTPFSNDMISLDGDEDDTGALEVTQELQQIATPSAVDLATGDTRLSLRGFPTPLMRNGFSTTGARDMLNTSR